jgi:hypothetical protein
MLFTAKFSFSQKFQSRILKSFFTTTPKNLNQQQAYQILFFGSDNFSVASLKALINESSMSEHYFTIH